MYPKFAQVLAMFPLKVDGNNLASKSNRYFEVLVSKFYFKIGTLGKQNKIGSIVLFNFQLNARR